MIIYSAKDHEKATHNSRRDLIGESFVDIAKGFHWAMKKDFQIWDYGVANDRQSTTERTLRRLEKNGRLRSVQFGGKRYPKIYALPTHTRNFDPSLKKHELGCTDTLVRIYRADMNSEVKGEQVFRGCGVLPDWGSRYPQRLDPKTGNMILPRILCGEFSTEDNVDEHRVIPSKITAYQNSFARIEERFQAKPVVLFILEVTRDRVRMLVEKWKPKGQFYFVDYNSFSSITLGQHLYEPIYFYSDGKECALRNV